MKRTVIVIALLLAVGFTARGQADCDATLKSPDGRMEARFELKAGVPCYSLYRDGKAVILPSRMGFTLEWRKNDMASGFQVNNVHEETFDETWQPVWGEEANIRNHYNEMVISLQQVY